MCVIGPGSSRGYWVGNVVVGLWGMLAWKWHSVREEPPYPRISHLICRERGGRTKTHRHTAGLTRTHTMGDACVSSVVHSHGHTEQKIIYYVWFLNMALKRIMPEMVGPIMISRHEGHLSTQHKKRFSAFKGCVHQNYKNIHRNVFPLSLSVSPHADSLEFEGLGCFYCLQNKIKKWI